MFKDVEKTIYCVQLELVSRKQDCNVILTDSKSSLQRLSQLPHKKFITNHYNEALKTIWYGTEIK